MFHELLKAFLLIFIAEMGDKTQILAMAFATRFPVRKVLLGIFIGAFLNHGLAVLLGTYISNFIPINTVQIIAGFAFVGFALWTLKAEGEEEEETKKSKFGPVVSVAVAFFIGELGDKTQLTAITLATDAIYPLAILAGTVSGMIVTGAIGIIIGKTLGDRIPEFAIKIVAAAVFMFFGVTKLLGTLPAAFLRPQYIIVFALLIIAAVYFLLKPTLEARRAGKESAFKAKSRELYNYYHQMGEEMEELCLGVGSCGKCQGNQCPVGYTKSLVKRGLKEEKSYHQLAFTLHEGGLEKPYNKEQVMENLQRTLELMKQNPSYLEDHNVQEIRRNLESILFGSSVAQIIDWAAYEKELESVDKALAEKVLQGLEK